MMAQGEAKQGTCRQKDEKGKRGDCWGPYDKIDDTFPMKRCRVCRRKS